MGFELTRRQMKLLATASIEEKRRIIATMTLADALSFDAWFENWAHEAQLPPEGGGWRVWLMMAGRGFGKTRAGAEWVHNIARSRPGVRIALVGATIDEARRVMVEGVSGILSVARRRRHRVRWEPSLGRLTWPNGSEAQLFSGDNPDGLRGPEHDIAWALLVLDAIVAAAVEEPARNDPPQSPAPGACYLVGDAPSGVWENYANHLASFGPSGWRYAGPVEGMTVTVKPTGMTAKYGATGWEFGAVRASQLLIDGVRVVGPQSSAILDPTGGSTVDAEARSALHQILGALRSHGLIATE